MDKYVDADGNEYAWLKADVNDNTTLYRRMIDRHECILRICNESGLLTSCDYRSAIVYKIHLGPTYFHIDYKDGVCISTGLNRVELRSIMQYGSRFMKRDVLGVVDDSMSELWKAWVL